MHTSGDAAGAVSLSNKVFITGSGNNDEWFFDYQSGVLNFIGDNLPAGVSFSGKSVYITGARYTGVFGSLTVPEVLGNLRVTDTTISSINTDANITLSPDGDGYVVIDSTHGFIPAAGPVSSRPVSPITGTTRFNTTTNYLEFFNGTSWINAGPEAGTITAQAIEGDGSTTVFTLERPAATESVIISTNGTVQKPNTAYTVSGDQITFAEAPAPGDTIDVRFITLTYSITGVSLTVATRLEVLALTGMIVGDVVYVTDGDTGNPCLAVYNGSAWKRVSFDGDL